MNNCPHCGRKLLSHISAKCNWCGTEIEDTAYLAQAEVQRAILEAERAQHDRQAVGFSAIVNSLGLLTGLSSPVLEKQIVRPAREHRQEPAAVPPPPAPEAPAAPLVSETQGRFDHLEL
ncbi:MAG: hypothetical protein M3Y13_11795 [Armatimonadota bacterium]|nr:hypothetical protein [Armatimonadota bacterium]